MIVSRLGEHRLPDSIGESLLLFLGQLTGPNRLGALWQDYKLAGEFLRLGRACSSFRKNCAPVAVEMLQTPPATSRLVLGEWHA